MNELTEEGMKLLGNLGIPYDSIGIRLRDTDDQPSRYVDITLVFYHKGMHVASIGKNAVHVGSADLHVTGINGSIKVVTNAPLSTSAEFSRFPDPE